MDSKQGFNACLRCKARKIKCDREMPKCSNCEKAGTPCLTTDAATGRQVPRSYLNHLEQKVQQLEHDLELSQRYLSVGSAYKFVPESIIPYITQWPILSISAQIVGAFRDRYAPMENSDLMTSVMQSMEPSTYQSLPIDLPPKRSAEQMIRYYFENCNSLFPILHREEFIKHYFEPVYGCVSPGIQLCSKFTNLNLRHSSTEPGTGTFYRQWCDFKGPGKLTPELSIQTCLFYLFMTFALAVANEKEDQMGPRYFSAAMNYFPVLSKSHIKNSRLSALQAVLLVALYGMVRPSTASAWYSIGDAIRMCIDMGLHVEEDGKSPEVNMLLSEHKALDAFNVDMRRRLFWTAFSMERTVCICMGRPSCIPDNVISCKMPSLADDSWLVPGDENQQQVANPPDRPSYKHVFYGMLLLRKIQYRARALLFERVDPPDVSIVRAERDKLYEELEQWYGSTAWDSATLNFDWTTTLFELAYLYTRVLLFRNSRGIPEPNLDEFSKLMDAGVKMLSLWARVGKEYRHSPWPLVHNCLQTAVACMHALYTTNALDRTYDLAKFEEVIHSVLQLLKNYMKTTETAETHYDFLQNMLKHTIEYLNSPESKKRKREDDGVEGPRPQMPQYYYPYQPYFAPAPAPPQAPPQAPTSVSLPPSTLPPIVYASQYPMYPQAPVYAPYPVNIAVPPPPEQLNLPPIVTKPPEDQ